MSPELETLDQLICGDMPLMAIRHVYPDPAAFLRGIHGLLKCGDVLLFWRWRDLFDNGAVLESPDGMTLSMTEQGAKRVV